MDKNHLNTRIETLEENLRYTRLTVDAWENLWIDLSRIYAKLILQIQTSQKMLEYARSNNHASLSLGEKMIEENRQYFSAWQHDFSSLPPYWTNKLNYARSKHFLAIERLENFWQQQLPPSAPSALFTPEKIWLFEQPSIHFLTQYERIGVFQSFFSFARYYLYIQQLKLTLNPCLDRFFPICIRDLKSKLDQLHVAKFNLKAAKAMHFAGPAGNAMSTHS